MTFIEQPFIECWNLKVNSFSVVVIQREMHYINWSDPVGMADVSTAVGDMMWSEPCGHEQFKAPARMSTSTVDPLENYQGWIQGRA